MPGLQALQQVQQMQQQAQIPPGVPPAKEAADHGYASCTPMIDRMAGASIGTSNFTTQSMWHTTDPGHHIFQSVVGIAMPGTPSDALSALITAPAGNNTCEGVSVQVIPLGADCNTVSNAVKSGGGGELNPLRGIRVLLDSNRDRLLLLPGMNNTCTAVSVKSYFNDGQ